MNLSNMTLQDLKELKRDIEDEISEREESELREFKELIKSYLRRERILEAVVPDKIRDHVNRNLIGTKDLSDYRRSD